MPPKKKKPTAKRARKRARKRGKNKKKKVLNPALVLLSLPFRLADRLADRFPQRFQFVAKWGLVCAFFGLMTFAVLATIYGTRSMKYDMAKVAEMPERMIIFDCNGNELGRMYGKKRDIIGLDQVSPLFRKALLAREDARFYDHGAVDVIGVGRAFFQNIKRGSAAQGASTLTMQLARNSFDLGTTSRKGGFLANLDRKFLEIAVSFRIQNHYSKDQILQHYMNRIFWGRSIHGIEEASRTYLEKSCSDLTLSEAAMLAGIIRGPNAFSPFRDINKAIRERDTTLDSMVHHGFITQAEAYEAKAEEITIRPENRRIIHKTYELDAVRKELEIILAENKIAWGGLNVHTTIDKSLQERAIVSLNKRLEAIESRSSYKHQKRSDFQKTNQEKAPAYIQGAVVAIENKTGAIRVLVGGRDASESQYNRATQDGRPIGSLFKPFVYAKAIEKGYKPETLINDDRIRPGEITGAQRGWSPNNSDGKFNGYQPLSYGLVHSRNTMSVRIGDYAGLEPVLTAAYQVGFNKNIKRYPSSFLGSWNATPMQVASAYTVFPNAGTRFRPYLIDKITDNKGNVLYSSGQIGYPAAPAAASWTVSQILRKVTKPGGTAASLTALGFAADCAGKTGTTNGYRDGWFAGYTSNLSCAVWVGMDQNAPTINRGYGSVLALPVWADVMKAASRLDYGTSSLRGHMPTKIYELCKESGRLATSQCRARHLNYTSSVPVGLIQSESDFCPIHPERAQKVRPSTLPQAIPARRDIVPAQRVHPVPAERVTPTPAERVN